MYMAAGRCWLSFVVGCRDCRRSRYDECMGSGLVISRLFHAYIRNGGVCWSRALVAFLDGCGMWVFVYNGRDNVTLS
jgi:hypothetical protein